MSQILNKVRDVDPNNSEAVKEVITTFFQNLTKHIDIDSNRWLRALENIINRFPKFCGTHRNTIETYLTKFLDSTNYYNVIEAAKCAHALQQVRPSQEKAATPKACWREHLVILSNAAHSLLGSMFPNSVDMYRNSGDGQKLRLQSSTTSPLSLALDQINLIPTQNNNVDKQIIFTTRLRNVFVFLQATLVEVYPVAKPVPPRAILEVIVRALSISNLIKTNEDIAKIVSVKSQALRTLDALVACLGPNLIPFSALIFKFVLQTLKWCSENVSEESSQVRRCAYESLRRWFRTLHTHRLADSSRGRSWEDELTRHILDDITPAKHLVQLTMSSQPTRHLSKKARRKLANSMLQESSIASHTPGEKNKIPVSEETNDDIALSALDCAETLLQVSGVFFKPATHKLFQERVVRECYNLDAYSDERALGLLRVLDALRKTTPSCVSPPTQYCLRLYSVLVNSRANEISKFSSQALLDIRMHLHGSPPSLNFAMEAPVAQKPDKPKKMSSRNRAALESLLGVDKVPSEAAEEVITLDEPSKKKPRLADDVQIADQISVSSESAESVEISDDDSDVLVINADFEEETAAKKVALAESTENTVDTTDSAADTTLALVMNQISNVVESITSSQPLEGKSQETITQASGEEDKTQEDKSNDAVGNSTEMPDTTDAPTRNIFTAHTQIPLDTSIDSEEHNSGHSMEVACDFPSTATEKVTILEKTEDDNLPCTNDTDDVAITCGQVVNNSQDDIEKAKEVDNKENEQPKVNGDKSPQQSVNNITDKSTGIKDVTVEDMLADFVDEIDEEKTEA